MVWEMPASERKIYLTFDDGPIPEVTPKILKILESYQALATFFCVGENVMKHPSTYQEVLDFGHSVGNHTFSHINAWKTTSRDYLADVAHCEEFVKSRLFRPPYGKIRREQALALAPSYHIILWSVLSWDFDKSFQPSRCLDNAIRYTRPGHIVVFHDSLKACENLFYVLPRFLDYFSRYGFTFEAIWEKDLPPLSLTTGLDE